MKRRISVKMTVVFFSIILFSNYSFSQDLKYREYSYSDLFKMIEEVKDTVFQLEDAIIRFDLKTDSIYGGRMSLNTQESNYFRKDTISIQKQLVFKNVQFLPFHIIKKGDNEFPEIYSSELHNLIFKKEVSFENCLAITINNSVFEDFVSFTKTEKVESIYNYFTNFISVEKVGLINHASFSDILIKKVKFKNGIDLNYNIYEVEKELIEATLKIENCVFNQGIENHLKYSQIFIRNLGSAEIINSIFNIQNIEITAFTNDNFILKNNNFSKIANVSFSTREYSRGINITGNTFLNDVHLRIKDLYPNMNIDWEQWHDKIINDSSFSDFKRNFMSQKKYRNIDLIKLQRIVESDSVYAIFKNEYYLRDKKSLKEEFKLRSKFVQFYRDQFEFDNANLVYIEYKDIETIKTQLKYQEDPTFNNFFTWKINQFLKIFSAYGTEPARAVVFSMYVILLFAFIYLLFPNSWDAHGRKRIMNRYAFFFTYMNKKAGIHEVYLDNQKEDLLEFDEFKTLVEQQGKKVPKFFTATALPLYKWAISRTKFSASVLKRVDIMKGTWSELPQSKRIWKSILLYGAFLIAVVYDIFIKMLNALMLSINTFTTLGFGEIPIKGLPRYLAIIQGFIGWFMLTIFSVSLISQLLN
ncbi:ion channel [Polaribacter sp.]|uniref:ion channel n=1 Tax=Polaribacter sp. TaxID=1920175 RepID=UPI0040485D73